MKFGKFIFTQQSTVIIGDFELIDSESGEFTYISGNFKCSKKGRPNFGNGGTGAIL